MKRSLSTVRKKAQWVQQQSIGVDAEASEHYDTSKFDLLHSWQKPSAETDISSLMRFNSTLNASDTGIGKTYIACAVMSALKRPFAVICPKTIIKTGWLPVLEHFGLEPLFVLNYEYLTRSKKHNWMTVKKGRHTTVQWGLPENTVLIFDECHRCKGENTLNSKMMVAAVDQAIGVYALSATAANSPLDMKAIGYALQLHRLTNYYHWCLERGCKPQTFGGLSFQGGPRIMLSLHKQIFPGRGSRVRVADLGDEFPDTIIEAKAYDLGSHTKAARLAYAEMKCELAELEAVAAKDGGKGKEVNILTIMLRARQRVELLKVPTLIQLCQDAVAEGDSVAVFVNFSETIKALREKWDGECGIIQGGQSDNARADTVKAFQENRLNPIFCNIRAGGVGVSLHDPATQKPRRAFICPTYSATDLKQAFGRVHRSGGGFSLQTVVFARDTIEEQACEKVERKLNQIATLNDGDLKSGISLTTT